MHRDAVSNTKRLSSMRADLTDIGRDLKLMMISIF